MGVLNVCLFFYYAVAMVFMGGCKGIAKILAMALLRA